MKRNLFPERRSPLSAYPLQWEIIEKDVEVGVGVGVVKYRITCKAVQKEREYFMSATLLTGVRLYMEIYLPKLFEIMTIHDTIRVLEWYVAPGDTVQPNANMLKVRAPGRTITIPTPPELTTPHQVIEIAKGEQLHLGDFLIKLEPIAPSPSA